MSKHGKCPDCYKTHLPEVCPAPSNNIDTELREQILTEFKQVHRLAPADYTENCTNVVMSILEAEIGADRNKLIKHLAFYYGLPEAEMRKVAENVK